MAKTFLWLSVGAGVRHFLVYSLLLDFIIASASPKKYPFVKKIKLNHFRFNLQVSATKINFTMTL